MGDDADDLEQFLDMVQKFLHTYESEYTSHVNKVVVGIITAVFYEGKSLHSAMEEILHYLEVSFPESVVGLEDMRGLCECLISENI